MIYDADYFIAKFEAIPDKFWTEGTYHRGYQHCAQGHIKDQHGADVAGEMSECLHKLLLTVCPKAEGVNAIARVNDGKEPRYPQPTPKARILAALRDVKAKELAK